MSEFKVGDIVFVDQWQGSHDPDNRTTINCFGVIERVGNTSYDVKPLYDNNLEPHVADLILYPCARYELTPAIEELELRMKKIKTVKEQFEVMRYC